MIDEDKITETKNSLVKQEDALDVYLQSLLVQSNQSNNNHSHTVEIDTSLASHVNQSVVEMDGSGDQGVSDAKRIIKKTNIPNWGNEAFSCVPLLVGGKTVLIPHAQFFKSKILDREIQTEPNLPDWILGNFVDDEVNIRVVDAAKIIGVNQQLNETASFKTIAIVSDGSWGLICDGIGDPLTLQPNEVQWRGPGSKRRWLIGTSLLSMSWIFDLRRIEMALLLERAVV